MSASVDNMTSAGSTEYRTSVPVPMIRVCPSCSRKNRVAVAHLARKIRCGACKTTMEAMWEPIEADIDTFDDVLHEARVPVLIYFWAGWNAVSRAAASEVKRAAADVAGRGLVLKVDIDQQKEIAARYSIQEVPNFVVVKDGVVVSQHKGQAGYTDLKKMIYEAR